MAKQQKITKHCKVCGAGAIKNQTVCEKCGSPLRTSKGMQKVQPINAKQISLIQKSIQKGQFGRRNEFMLMFLMNTALRISDALKVKVGMVRGKETLELIEKKTNKWKKFPINDELREAIDEYTGEMDNDDYLFPSRKPNKDGEFGAISRMQAHRILRDASQKLRIGHFGCHSARKTFARLLYEEYGDISLIMRILNHSSEAITLAYIGLRDEQDNERLKNFTLFSKSKRRKTS